MTYNQVPNFELNVSPKTEPGLLPLGSVSIANIDILAKVLKNLFYVIRSEVNLFPNLQSEPPAPVPLPFDLIAQHCTLLPPDMVSIMINCIVVKIISMIACSIFPMFIVHLSQN